MLEEKHGKLLVYTPNLETCHKRLKSVSVAVEKTAKNLRLDVEVVVLKSEKTPVYVYYTEGDAEAVPLYCDNNSTHSTEHVCTILRNMMFVLSFHPKFSALRRIRKRIMRFS